MFSSNKSNKIMIFWLFVLLVPINALAETKLKIVTSHFPPYVNEHAMGNGFLIEMLHEVAREMGVSFEFSFLPWRRCENNVEKLEAWGAIPYVPTPERQKVFYFSDALYIKYTRFFYYSPDGRRKDIDYRELNDLKGFIIGGIKGYYYVKKIQEKGLKIDLVNEDEQNFSKLKVGRIDLAIAVDVLGWYIIKKRFPGVTENFFTIEKPFHEGGNYLMTSKKYPNASNLLNQFNAALKKIKDNGIYQNILNEHGIVLSY